MHDTTLQVMNAEALAAEDHLQVVFTTGIALPVGPQQAIPIPTGHYRVPMRKEIAIAFAEDILEKAEELPDAEEPRESKLVVANSLQGVDEVARQNRQFRGNGT